MDGGGKHGVQGTSILKPARRIRHSSGILTGHDEAGQTCALGDV